MSLYVLDTDTVTLLLHGNAEIANAAAANDPGELSVTIINVEEVLTGWYSQVRRAKKDHQLARAYQALHEAIAFFAQVRILGFDAEAIRIFHRLRRAHRRAGANDLRIAATVQLHKGILVTRNRSDFNDIAALPMEDWF